MTVGHSGDGPQVNSVSISTLPLEDGHDDEEGYVSGANTHATRLVLIDDDQDDVDVYYPGDEAYA